MRRPVREDRTPHIVAQLYGELGVSSNRIPGHDAAAENEIPFFSTVDAHENDGTERWTAPTASRRVIKEYQRIRSSVQPGSDGEGSGTVCSLNNDHIIVTH
jgi:hypothetical protein